MRKYILLLAVPLFCRCGQNGQSATIRTPSTFEKNPAEISTVGDIPVPENFNRVQGQPGSFPYWLRRLRLKKDKTVYLFNGMEKPNQRAQYAVVDMSRSKTDLQQCADVVMRLRAEYLYSEKKYDSIRFMDYEQTWYNWKGKDNRQKFEAYLNHVFGWCGSASLQKQLKPVRNFSDIRIGDVLVKGGFPGHAMLVSDMAVNNRGEKLFMLIQGYQPAQDIHIVINPTDNTISPWYKIPAGHAVETPEWVFFKDQLYRW